MVWFKNSDKKNLRNIVEQIGKKRFEELIKNDPIIKVDRLSQMYLEFYNGHFYLMRCYPAMDLVITCIDDLKLPLDNWELKLHDKQRTTGWIK